MAGKKKTGRLIALILAAAVVPTLFAVRLMKLQIVQGADYLRQSQKTSVGVQEIKAARGEIIDVNGVALAANRVGYNVMVDKAFFPTDIQNDVLLRVVRILQAQGDAWEDTLPISSTAPYTFEEGREADVAKLQSALKQQSYSTAENCMDAMIEMYAISDKYTVEERRVVAGIRYEMQQRDFSLNNPYTFARDVTRVSVAQIQEQSFDLPGIGIEEEAARSYENGSVAPNILGVVGAITADQYEKRKSEGYKLNDTHGRSGIEVWGEDILRGKNGTRTIVQNARGEAVSTEVTEAAVPGNTIQLTLDSRLQTALQEDMQEHVDWLRGPDNAKGKGSGVIAGSLVVLDVKTGGVLAMVNYPNYDINDLLANYGEVANREGSPLNNRPTMGIYRPGSTFKTVTATTALQLGEINGASTVYCNGRYTFYPDITPPRCATGPHGNIGVSHALGVSCNIFFYDVGRRIGIQSIIDMARNFGLGTDTGIEITSAKNTHIAGPEYFSTIDQDWTPGQVLQAAIGQSETGVTPLQMAVQASVLANKGVRYRAHLVDAVYSYDRQTLVSKTEPEVMSVIEDQGNTFDLVEKGMIEAAYSLVGTHGLAKFTDLQVALKTGTPQVSTTITNSAVVGYAPVGDPQIAFAIMLEHGEYSRYLVDDIINEYFYEGKFGQSTQETSAVLP